MLKPATPLTILLLVAFALLLVSVITTPLVKGIPLASFNGVDYGVFGCCKGSQCSGIKIGYGTYALRAIGVESRTSDGIMFLRHSAGRSVLKGKSKAN